MPELKGSQTHKNLKDAFAGESMATRRPTSRFVALVTEPAVIGRILKHLAGRGHDARAGPWAGAATAPG